MIDGWAVLDSSKLPLFWTFSGASLPSDLQISKAAFATQLMPCWSYSNGTGHVLGVPCKTWSSITSMFPQESVLFVFQTKSIEYVSQKGRASFFQVYLRLKIIELHFECSKPHWTIGLLWVPHSSYQSLTIGRRAARTWRRGIASFRSFSGFATTACRRGCLRNVGTCVAPQGLENHWDFTWFNHQNIWSTILDIGCWLSWRIKSFNYIDPFRTWWVYKWS